MRQRTSVLVLGLLCLICVPSGAELAPAPFAVGFAVGVPYELPVDWAQSFSYLTVEALLSQNLTAAFELGTYPSQYPDLFEGTAGVSVKAWVGPVNAFAGGGFTLQWRRVGTAWGFSPHLSLKGGFQVWPLESVGFIAQFRTHEPIPMTWTFDPEFSLGISVAYGNARPDPLVYDPATLWLLVGLGVAAMIAFLPRI